MYSHSTSFRNWFSLKVALAEEMFREVLLLNILALDIHPLVLITCLPLPRLSSDWSEEWSHRAVWGH